MRNDGRGCFDMRRVTFDVGSQASATGSCRLRAGETDLCVGVKCDMVKPNAETPNMGQVHIVVEVAASVSVAFSEGRDGEDLGKQLSALLESLCASDDVIDRKALCVLPGVFAWDVYVDVLVQACGGNLLDSVSLALCAVLSETALPKVTVEEALEEGEDVQLSVDDRPEVGTAFPLKKLPLCVTVAQVGKRLLLDVTPEEELCAEALMCVVVDGKCGAVVGMHQLGRGLLDPSLVPSMLEHSRAAAAAIVQQLEAEAVMADKAL